MSKLKQLLIKHSQSSNNSMAKDEAFQRMKESDDKERYDIAMSKFSQILEKNAMSNLEDEELMEDPEFRGMLKSCEIADRYDENIKNDIDPSDRKSIPIHHVSRKIKLAPRRVPENRKQLGTAHLHPTSPQSFFEAVRAVLLSYPDSHPLEELEWDQLSAETIEILADLCESIYEFSETDNVIGTLQRLVIKRKETKFALPQVDIVETEKTALLSVYEQNRIEQMAKCNPVERIKARRHILLEGLPFYDHTYKNKRFSNVESAMEYLRREDLRGILRGELDDELKDEVTEAGLYDIDSMSNEPTFPVITKGKLKRLLNDIVRDVNVRKRVLAENGLHDYFTKHVAQGRFSFSMARPVCFTEEDAEVMKSLQERFAEVENLLLQEEEGVDYFPPEEDDDTVEFDDWSKGFDTLMKKKTGEKRKVADEYYSETASPELPSELSLMRAYSDLPAEETIPFFVQNSPDDAQVDGSEVKASLHKSKRNKRSKDCPLCIGRRCEPLVPIEYTNIRLLNEFIDEEGRIQPRRFTGMCARRQRQISRCIKRAQKMALLPTGCKWTFGHFDPVRALPPMAYRDWANRAFDPDAGERFRKLMFETHDPFIQRQHRKFSNREILGTE